MGYKTIIAILILCSNHLFAQQNFLNNFEIYDKQNEKYELKYKPLDTTVYVFIGNTNCIDCISNLGKVLKRKNIKKIVLIGYSGSIWDLKLAYARYARHFEKDDIYFYKSNAKLFDDEKGEALNLFGTYISPNMLLQTGNIIDTLPYQKLFDKKGQVQKNIIKKMTLLK